MTKSKTQKKTQTQVPKAEPKTEPSNGELTMTETAQWSDPIIIGRVGSLTISAREPLNQLAVDECNPSMMTALALHARLGGIFAGLQQLAEGHNALVARVAALEPDEIEEEKEDSEAGGGDSSEEAAE